LCEKLYLLYIGTEGVYNSEVAILHGGDNLEFKADLLTLKNG
jgi:hypothetical protein